MILEEVYQLLQPKYAHTSEIRGRIIAWKLREIFMTSGDFRTISTPKTRLQNFHEFENLNIKMKIIGYLLSFRSSQAILTNTIFVVFVYYCKIKSFVYYCKNKSLV